MPDPGFIGASIIAVQMLACGPLVLAEIRESSPDVVRIENRSAEGWSISSLSFDLSTSEGRIFIDSSPADDGFAGSAPFITTKGRIKVRSVSGTEDGSTHLSFSFDAFPSPDVYHFLIDFDDGLYNSDFGQAYIDPHEVAGTALTATFTDPEGISSTATGIFSADGKVVLGGGGCV